MTRRAAWLALLALMATAAAGPAAAQGRRDPGAMRGAPDGEGRPRQAYANPSAAIAAELEFARLAQ